MPWYVSGPIGLAIGAIVFFLLGIRYRKSTERKTIGEAEDRALSIINDAHQRAESKTREALLEANEKILKDRSEYEKEVRERRTELQRQENRLQQKEDNLDRKLDAIEKKEEDLARKHAAADEVNAEVERVKREQMALLERISGFTPEQARAYIIQQVEADVTHETALKIKEVESRMKEECAQERLSRRPSSAAPPTRPPK